MSFDYKYVIPPTGQVDNNVLREMFVDIKDYINDTSNFDFANKALSNLASVAINTSLVSDTDNTDDLGTSSINWKDIYLKGDIKIGSNIVFSPNSSGSVNLPVQPSFLVTNSSTQTNVTGDGTDYTIQFDTEITDQAANFASNTFTAPVTGKYLLCFTTRPSDLATNHTTISASINTSNRNYGNEFVSGSNPYTRVPITVAVVADMDANDTAACHIIVAGGSKVVDLASTTLLQFSGQLIA